MSMTWKQFKDDMESHGVTDDMFIGDISFSSRIFRYAVQRPKPEVTIHTIGYGKLVDIR